MVRIEWADAARRDRLSIFNYIDQHRPQSAVALDERIQHGANRLETHPYAGRPGRLIGTRELVVHQNYLLIYRIDADAIRILRVIHAARRWP